MYYQIEYAGGGLEIGNNKGDALLSLTTIRVTLGSPILGHTRERR